MPWKAEHRAGHYIVSIKVGSIAEVRHYLLRGCPNTAPVRLRLRISTPLPVFAAMFFGRAKQTALRPEGGRAGAVELA